MPDMPHILVWDIETVPDLAGYAAANGHDGKSDDEIRAELGEKFPKHIYHSIICIGALIAHWDGDHWVVEALGAPHVGERSEKELIAAFADRIAELKAAARHIQRVLVRPASSALSRNGSQSTGDWFVSTSLLSSIYGRRSRFM
jgi:hypothetical protein